MTDQMIAWEIEEWIRDYKFMLREIKRLNRVLNKVDFISTKLTATYGMKRACQGDQQESVRQNCDRWTEEKDGFTNMNLLCITWTTLWNTLKKKKHRIVYDCMMEGMSYTAIANHLDCSRDTIRKIKTAIIGNIVNKVKEANFLQYLNSFKSAV
ncbi:Hypothetical protein YjcO protein [Bacillus subtilis subsp. subtilis str. BSP1]|nr:Hypothetical protein YjcO protein [Bacillus subtilis subsp. subtilis str. BSP1]